MQGIHLTRYFGGDPKEEDATNIGIAKGFMRLGNLPLLVIVEVTYGASILQWVRQTYEGRLDFKGATSTVEDVTGRKPQTLEMWVRANRQAVLSAASLIRPPISTKARVVEAVGKRNVIATSVRDLIAKLP
jgi:hypothetical protein